MIRTKFLIAAIFTAALVLLSGGTAHAQYDGGGGGTPTTTPPDAELPIITVVRGESVDVTGTECGPGDPVTITFDDGTVLANVTADDDGNFATTVTIPADATLGEHLITATCPNGEDQFLRVNVIDAAAPAPGGTTTTGAGSPLPRTGSNTAPLVGIGAAALVLGAAFVYGSRSPRRAGA